MSIQSNVMNSSTYEDIQPYWKALESRVVNRKSRRDGVSGRFGERKSEEDYWLEAGVYHSESKEESRK